MNPRQQPNTALFYVLSGNSCFNSDSVNWATGQEVQSPHNLAVFWVKSSILLQILSGSQFAGGLMRQIIWPSLGIDLFQFETGQSQRCLDEGPPGTCCWLLDHDQWSSSYCLLHIISLFSLLRKKSEVMQSKYFTMKGLKDLRAREKCEDGSFIGFVCDELNNSRSSVAWFFGSQEIMIPTSYQRWMKNFGNV